MSEITRIEQANPPPTFRGRMKLSRPTRLLGATLVAAAAVLFAPFLAPGTAQAEPYAPWSP